MDWDNEVYVGLYLYSHNPAALESATFSNVRIIKPFDPDFSPYHDNLGSNLKLRDVETGHREIIHQFVYFIKALNWTVDGK